MSSGAGGPSFTVRYADILFARGVLDPQGQNPKNRRVVVLTPDSELAAGYPIVAAAVTGTIPPQLPADYVLLPYSNSIPPRVKTGLTKRGAAVCSWVVVVNPNDVAGRSGFVPPIQMADIQRMAGPAAKAMGGWP